jgi:hypothetical protein
MDVSTQRTINLTPPAIDAVVGGVYQALWRDRVDIHTFMEGNTFTNSKLVCTAGEATCKMR